MAGVAQLVRAPGCGSGGRGFETRRLPHPLSLTLQRDGSARIHYGGALAKRAAL